MNQISRERILSNHNFYSQLYDFFLKRELGETLNTAVFTYPGRVHIVGHKVQFQHI